MMLSPKPTHHSLPTTHYPTFLQWTSNNLLQLLFPITCLGCACRGGWLCPACWRELARSEPQHCIGCGRDDPTGQTCIHCQERWGALRGSWFAGSYQTPLLKQAIAAFKYDEIKTLARPLAGLLFSLTQRPGIRKVLDRFRECVIVPAPMSRRRERRRGFNQAACLAQEYGILAGLPFSDALEKRDRETQVGLSREERLANLQDAISVRNPLAIFSKTVILVDDVVTTGATAIACATVLRQSGARAVWVLALARD